VDRILAANQIADPNLIVAGTLLLLPAPDAPVAAAAVSSSTAGMQVITVQPGESLSVIAQRLYGSASYAGALASLNGLPDVDLVFAGMKLKAPASPPEGGAAPAKGKALGGRRICLDPGHGGVEEPGAVAEFNDGRVLREADVTLDMTRTLRAWLQADGAAVTMTRTGDTFLGLDERAAICNQAAADIAVSVHLNSVSSSSYNGALALFFKLIDKRLAERLAAALQAGLARNAPGQPFTSFGAQPFDGRVLLRTTMPAVIVEPVFLSHPGEARALLAPTSQENSRRSQIVVEIYRGIRAYFGP
jgi:N-acetylmuramoyl-L-alanine amidase